MFHMPSFPELIVIFAIGVLLFGKRLPEVGKSLGKGITEFKKGLKGIEDEPEVTARANPPIMTRLPDQPIQPQVPLDPTAQAPKFDPYTGKPLDQTTPIV